MTKTTDLLPSFFRTGCWLEKDLASLNVNRITSDVTTILIKNRCFFIYIKQIALKYAKGIGRNIRIRLNIKKGLRLIEALFTKDNLLKLLLLHQIF